MVKVGESSESRARIAGLDLLRLVAIVMVLFRHTPGGVGFLTTGGWTGVDLFFVLSGWLVSGLLFREYRDTGFVQPGRFLIRRGFKIYPAFWLLIAFSIPWVIRLHPGAFPLTWKNLAAELTFTQNYFHGVWGHTWSLAIEEHFYLLLAVGVWLMARKRLLSYMPLLFVLIAAGCLTLRFINEMIPHPFDYYRDMFPTHLRIDSLTFGVALAYGHYFSEKFRNVVAQCKSWVGFVGAACFVPAYIWPQETIPWMRVLGPTLFYLGGGLMVVSFGQWRTRNRTALFLAGLGGASYSIYLWHMWAIDLTTIVQKRVGIPILLFGTVVGSIVLGTILARLVEVPALALRDRLFPATPAHTKKTRAAAA